MHQKTLEERGYYRTWPPVQGDLSPRDINMIQLGEHAEAYIQYRQRQQAGRGQSSLSHREYDVEASRREWAQSIQ